MAVGTLQAYHWRAGGGDAIGGGLGKAERRTVYSISIYMYRKPKSSEVRYKFTAYSVRSSYIEK